MHQRHRLIDIARASGVHRDRAGRVEADSLELWALGGDDGGGGRAAVVEEFVEGGADGLNVGGGDAEGGGRGGDLRDEVAELERVEVHESVGVFG